MAYDNPWLEDIPPMNNRNLYIGLAVLAGVLLLVAVIAYFATGDAVVGGTAGTAAAVAAAEALRRRQAATAKVEAAKVDTVESKAVIEANAAKAKADMAAVPPEVEKLSDAAKVDEGNKLLG